MSHHYIRFDNVHYTYPNGYEALRGIDLYITHGEKVGLLGENGAGKSTLLLHTNGLLLPSQGSVDVGGVPVVKKTLRTVRRSVGMVFQNPDDQLFMPTIADDIAFGLLNMGLPADVVAQRVDHALRRVGLTGLGGRQPSELSGGQRRNAAMATVLAMQPDVLVLDEPTSNLDFRSRRNFIDIIKDFLHTCLIASHDLEMIRELCTRIVVISEGRIADDCPIERFDFDRFTAACEAGRLDEAFVS